MIYTCIQEDPLVITLQNYKINLENQYKVDYSRVNTKLGINFYISQSILFDHGSTTQFLTKCVTRISSSRPQTTTYV